VLELHDEGVDFREMAVLYRAHYHSMEIQLEFTRRGIPFGITSGLRFRAGAREGHSRLPEIRRESER